MNFNSGWISLKERVNMLAAIIIWLVIIVVIGLFLDLD